MRCIPAALMTVGILLCSSPFGQGQQPANPRPTSDKTLIADVDSQSQLHARFQRLLTGAKLRGQFTMDGQPLDKLHEEAYDIEKVEKMPEGDQWVITARIKYGDHDLVVPVPLAVKWAGTTPVLTLDDITLPGFGTFGARVVLHKNKYAGTWQHDQVGGHLFGTIEMAASEESPAGK